MAVSRIQQFELQLKHEFAQDRVEAIIRESPAALGEKIRWIRTYFEEEWKRSIVGRYQVAVLLREIYDDVNDNKGAVYGAKAVEALRAAFGWDDGVIYHALNVADAFTPEQIEAIAGMRLPGGKPVSYSHVVVLANVEDDRARQKLLQQAVKEGWTSKKLANAVERSESSQAGKREERRGRPLATPRGFDAVLDQQGDFVKDFLNRNDQVWTHPQNSLSSQAVELDMDDFTQERADRLKQHADSMVLLSRKSQERAEEAMQVRERFLHVLKQRNAGQKRLGVKNPEPTDE